MNNTDSKKMIHIIIKKSLEHFVIWKAFRKEYHFAGIYL